MKFIVTNLDKVQINQHYRIQINNYTIQMTFLQDK